MTPVHHVQALARFVHSFRMAEVRG
jgi:hypothetical protein